VSRGPFLDFAKCRAIGHQCGGGDDAIRVRFYDGSIYARCESEVVRINHEAPHSGSLAGDFVPVAVLSVRRPFLAKPNGSVGINESLSADLTSSAPIRSLSLSTARVGAPTIYKLAVLTHLEALTSGTRVAIPSIDPVFARRRTSINIVLERN
jgi:hypothetical protein